MTRALERVWLHACMRAVGTCEACVSFKAVSQQLHGRGRGAAQGGSSPGRGGHAPLLVVGGAAIQGDGQQIPRLVSASTGKGHATDVGGLGQQVPGGAPGPQAVRATLA
jgi:hypothetical protein